MLEVGPRLKLTLGALEALLRVIELSRGCSLALKQRVEASAQLFELGGPSRALAELSKLVPDKQAPDRKAVTPTRRR